MSPIVRILSLEEKNYLEILGHLQLSYGKTATAISIYKILSKDPLLRPKALNALATAYLVEKRLKEALATAEESLKLQKESEGRKIALTLISRAAYLTGDEQAAEKALSESLRNS